MRRKVVCGLAATAVFGVVVIGTATVLVSAEGARMAERPPIVKLIAGNLMRMMLTRWELNITPDQQTEFQKLREAHRAEAAAVARKVIEAKRALAEEVLAEQPDEQKVRAAASRLGSAIADAAALAAKVVPEGRKVLTPEQREKIKATRAECLKAEDTFLQEIEAK